MAKITIKGREYDLRVNLWVTERMEEEYGDFSEAMKNFRKQRKVSQVKKMFAILANAGQMHAGKPADVKPEDLDDCNLHDLDRIAKAMGQAMEEGMRAETVNGGEADDEVADGYAAELEAREKNG